MNYEVIVTCAVTGAGDTVGKHPAVPSMHENTEEKRVVLEELSEEDEHDQTAD